MDKSFGKCGARAISEQARWEHFPHEADMGVRGFGPTLESAFEQAALALMNIIVDTNKVEPEQRVEINMFSKDRELLLVDWLNGIIYEMSVRHMLFSCFNVEIRGDHCYGQMWGEKADRARHQPAVEIKGATYTALKVEEVDGQWMAQCIVDV